MFGRDLEHAKHDGAPQPLTFTRRFSAVVMVGFTGVALAVGAGTRGRWECACLPGQRLGSWQGCMQGQPKEHIVKTQTIQDTLLRGREVQKSGTSHTFALDDLPPCPGHFRVVIDYKFYDSPGFQGVINAYHSDDPSTLSAGQSHQSNLAVQSPC